MKHFQNHLKKCVCYGIIVKYYNKDRYKILLNFVKIEARGFKSFADKIEIPFQEGVTAIIGPNGCGKSNVADAIRWTLGEQSAKSLRGKNMQDVIFAGTEKRKSTSYCEVSLTFNNSDQHIFPSMPFDEVVITRKLDRSGLSEYYINHNRVRMRDVISLFHDTGIGKEGYSIIGQGRVGEIMSAKPGDRRQIFEEAAGISKFRAQRTEAERKLEKTALNLETANQVIEEIQRQINPLRKQAETAQKYAELTEQLKGKEVNLYIYNYENIQVTKQRICDRISASEKDLKVREMQLNETIRKYDACIRESAGIDRVYDDCNGELITLKVDAARLEGEAGVLRERINHIQGEIARLNTELQSIDNQLDVSAQLISNAEEKKEAEFQAYLEANKEAEALQQKYSLLTKSLAGAETDLETRNSEYIRSMEDLGVLKSNLSGFIAEKGINDERAKTLLALCNQQKSRLDEELTNLAIYDGNVKSTKERMRTLMSEYNEALSTKLESQEAIKSYAEDIVNLNSKLGLAKGNLDLLTSIKNEYSGYQEAVKRLMQDSKHDPVLASKIWGVLAEVITVPNDFEAAIEYALGGAMQNVLVETERDASDLINYLKQKGYGRVTFRPLTSCRPRLLNGENRGVLNEPGCYGLASDLIKYDKKFDGFVQTLLGGTVVVNNIDNAVRIFKKYNQSVKIVTLDGDIFSRGGEITGGSRRTQTQGLLAQEKKIEQAQANLEKIKNNIVMFNRRREESEQELQMCEERIETLNKEISELRIENSLNEDKAKQCFEATESLKIEISKNAEEYEIVKARIKELEEKISSIDQLEKVVSEKREEYNALLASSKSVSTDQKSEREQMAEQVTEIKVKLAGHKSILDGIDNDLFRYRRDRQELEDEKLDIIASLKREQQNLNNIHNAPEKTVFSKEDEAKISALEKQIADLSERKRTISDEIVALDAEKTRLTDEKSALIEKKIRDEAMLENADIDIRNQQAYILETYDLTYTSALELKDPEFKAYGTATEIAELKKARNRLGDVNPLALQTLKETEERLEEQTIQRDDIQKAYDDIVTIINELTGEMQNKFTDAFNQISENFKEVFQQLFGGGKGDLRLNMQETDDVLEAGIDIFAQPPGKKLQNINLLSGGEQALTAISILFAILKLKPMPFCVLDEIEAALDDANVNLFAEFLKKFSTYTQFIVITHRKPTMRHADTIFGVTMEEKGVTKIVSIEFEEAAKHAK